MNESVPSRRIIRFGVFEVDLASAELRKNGLKVRLSGQPFQILVLLLERPAELISREELQKKLWPDGTFVDFDHSLNTAINKIREALGDSAENPRFVETLARRGYRFIAPVENAAPSAASAKTEPAKGEHPNSLLVDSIASPSPRLEVSESKQAVRLPPSRTKRRFASFVSIGLLLGGAAAAFWWLSGRDSQTTRSLKLTRLTSDSGLTTDAVISFDGKLVAYASDRSGEGNLDIWVKQVAGGEPLRLTYDPADDYQPDFSPDGGQIVFRSEREGGGIYLISALGGAQERLLAARGRNPRFSPDGSRIAYWTGFVWSEPLGGQAANGSLFVMATSSGTSHELLSDFRSAGCPTWSFDGKYLLFFGSHESRFPGGADSDWWVISREGGRAVKTGAFDALSKQQIATSSLSVVPLATQWIDNLVFFYAQLGDSVNLWQVPISPGTWQVTGPAQRLTSGTGLEIRPSLAKDGTLVFSSLTRNGDLWSLALDTDRPRSPGRLEQLSSGGAAEHSPSVSADGKILVFVSDRSGSPHIWIKNLDTRKETRLTATEESEIHPEISSDGSQVAYFSPSPQWGIRIVPIRGGPGRDLCPGCGVPWDFSPDNRHLAFFQGDDVSVLDVSTGKRTPFIKSASGAWQANFSPDGHWVTFGESLVSAGRSRILVAPFRAEAAIPEKEWTALTDGSSWDDKPRWSPDGNIVYFISDRDGFACLWAQRLDPSSKHPKEPPFEVYHVHQARRSMSNVGYWTLEMSVARDKIVFNMVELTGNIWMTKLELK